MYYKVLLTALGYEQSVDFEWANVIAYAASKGMSNIASVTELTINDFARPFQVSCKPPKWCKIKASYGGFSYGKKNINTGRKAS